ncbi:MAG: hypothetical protein H7210_00220 [Pyrinomonadaceae bacterium]|nr:hypothetical protein [Phycisphaerales bacterium]
MQPRLFSVAAGVLLFSAAAHVQAGVVTLTMQNGDDGGSPFNTTLFTITNNSAPGVALTSMTMGIGDTQFLFDQLYQRVELFTGGDGTQTAVLNVGDRTDDGAGGDLFSYGFLNFAPGVTVTGQWDIDFDSGAFDVDARTVLFNNGASPNAAATFAFSDGSSFSYTFPDLPLQDQYTLVIPGAGTAATMLVGFGLLTRRRR